MNGIGQTGCVSTRLWLLQTVGPGVAIWPGTVLVAVVMHPPCIGAK